MAYFAFSVSTKYYGAVFKRNAPSKNWVISKKLNRSQMQIRNIMHRYIVLKR